MKTRGDVWLKRGGSRWHFTFRAKSADECGYLNGSEDHPGDLFTEEFGCTRERAITRILTLLSGGAEFI